MNSDNKFQNKVKICKTINYGIIIPNLFMG